MQVTRDEWTPLLQSIRDKVKREARKELLFKVINEIRFITQSNFGNEGIDRPEPWDDLKEKYAQEYHKGNRTPTLILDPDEHFLRNGSGKRMIESFRTTCNDAKASLTNTAPYADQHQFGAKYKKLPARPFYPVRGDRLTVFAEDRVSQILKAHFETGSL